MNETRILQWNTWHRAKSEHIAGHILMLAQAHGVPDVLCLQEITEPTVHAVAVAVGATQMTYTPTRIHKNGLIEGQAIISRRPFLESADYIKLSKGGRGLFQDNEANRRVLQKVTIRSIAAERITVATTHLSYRTPVNTAVRRQELANLVDGLADAERLVLTGDFNATARSSVIRAIGTMLVRADLHETTWTSSHVDGRGLVQRQLDHVLVTPDMEIAHAAVLDEGPSDHKPLFVRVRPV